jgi:signal transduction histidine kinase
VREVAGMVEPLLRQHDNELVVRIRSPLGSMTGDPTRVRQSLHHLVSNAAKFTERGHVTIEATRETQGGRDWVVLLVKDDGAGMSDEQLRVALEAFQQVDSSATRKVGGTGLGLALTKQLCELMGGALEVDSRVGEGSTFKMRLPAAPATRASMDTIDFGIARG